MIYLVKIALIPAIIALLAAPRLGFESDYFPPENEKSEVIEVLNLGAFLAVNPTLHYRTAYLHEKTLVVDATAYNSVPEQTNDEPFITASGTYTRDGVIAANFLQFGTTLKIPELFGDKV